MSARMIVWLMSACAGPARPTPDERDPTETPEIDADADGYAAGDDCDDDAAAIHPGAAEQCDGADEDCDGVIDEEAIDAIVSYADTDNDGYGDPAVSRFDCSIPIGFVANADDCDDVDAAINPETVWYGDADADGFGDAAISTVACVAPEGFVANTTDCDPVHRSAYTGAPEQATDGVDNDCDGATAATSIAELPKWQARGSYTSTNLGLSLASGDFDGDGVPDLVLGGQMGELDGELRRGTVAMFAGPLEETDTPVDESSASTLLYGELLEGWSIACGVGDLDADGFDDLVIGNPASGGLGTGAAYVVRGPIADLVDLTLDTQRWDGSAYGEGFGWCAAPGDVDGDGISDVVLSAPETSGSWEGLGSVYVLRGPADQKSVDDADQILRGTDPEHIGIGPVGLGDLNGDGLGDYSVSNGELYEPLDDGIAAYLVTDFVPGVVHPRDVGITVAFDLRGSSVYTIVSRVDDVDGDGYADVAFGSDDWEESRTLYVVRGSFGSETQLALSTHADVMFQSSVGGPYRWLSWATSLGEWNGDGTGALAIADSRFATEDALAHFACGGSSGCDQGAIYLMATPIDAGTYDLATEADRIEGAFPDEALGGGFYGRAVMGGTDLNADAFPDLVIGAPDGAGDRAGSAFVLFGG